MTLGRFLAALLLAAQRFGRHQGPLLAGALSNAALLALFPALVFLGSLAGFLGALGSTDWVVGEADRYLPPEVAAFLKPAIEEALASRSGAALAAGLALGLAFASFGVEEFRAALTMAAGRRRRRNALKRWTQNIVFVLSGSLVFLVVTMAVVVWPLLWNVLPAAVLAGLDYAVLADPLRYLVSFALIAGLTAAVYHWLPDVPPSLREAMPGAVTATVLWIGLAVAFSWYLASLANYALLYGSLAGVASTLVFVYLSAAVFLYGAELNAALTAHRAEVPPTTG